MSVYNQGSVVSPQWLISTLHQQVGGSLSGLMSGVVLKRHGHNVRILNRDPSSSLQGQGAGISALQNVQDYLSTYDVTKRPHSVYSSNIQFLDKEGKLTKTWNISMSMTSWNVLYYRLRANFDGLLSEYCPELPKEAGAGEGKAIYSPGKNVTDVKYADGQVTVYFDNFEGGSGSLHADLVLAADGPGSTIRQILQPQLQRTYVGYVAWRGTALESDVSEETRKAFGGKISYYQSTNPRGHMLMYIPRAPPFHPLPSTALSHQPPSPINRPLPSTVLSH